MLYICFRSRDRERDRQREKERERRKKGLPAMKDQCLSSMYDLLTLPCLYKHLVLLTMVVESSYIMYLLIVSHLCTCSFTQLCGFYITSCNRMLQFFHCSMFNHSVHWKDFQNYVRRWTASRTWKVWQFGIHKCKIFYES